MNLDIDHQVNHTQNKFISQQFIGQNKTETNLKLNTVHLMEFLRQHELCISLNTPDDVTLMQI